MTLQNIFGDLALDSAFARLIKFEPLVGKELRVVENDTDLYHASAADGSNVGAPVWEVVRFYKNASGDIVRVRYRTGVIFTDITIGW